MRKLLVIFCALCALFVLGGCRKKGDTFRVGATPVPHAVILELVKEDLKEQGITLEIIEFTDYVTPNIALNDGQIDANFFQHFPYLESFTRERGMKLVSAGGVHVEPLGLYSSKHGSLSDIPSGATIAIPNDPTNEGRALLLLEANGLIMLNDKAGLEGTPVDISSNPQKLKFRELDAAQLPRVLKDVDAVVINGNFAMEAGLNPLKDAMLLEGAESPYVNIIAVRQDSLDDARLHSLLSALRSEKVRDFILKTYNGGVVPAF